MRDADAIVIGAGPAGLAAAYELGRRGIDRIVLERGDRVACNWARLYDSLTLHTGRHMSTLPGMRFPRGTPLFPTRADFTAYLETYAARFDIAVATGYDIARVQRAGNAWRVDPRRGEPLCAGTVVVATGIISNPVVPRFAAQEAYTGRVMHAVEYRRPDVFAARRVLVVGVGNSGGEIASELAASGARVDVAVRSGANVVPLTLAGVPIQYLSRVVRTLPRAAQERIVELIRRLQEKRRGPPVLPRPPQSPLDAIPLIGFHLVDAIRAGTITVRPTIACFTPDGVRFTDGTDGSYDAVILATGYRPALDLLGTTVRTDARGFALRTDRVTSADAPGLFFVGHNYDATGGIANIRRDAGLAARGVLAHLERARPSAPAQAMRAVVT